MGVELEGEKQLKCGADQTPDNFFLTRFNFYKKIKEETGTPFPVALREIDAAFARSEAEKSTYYSCNPHDTSGELCFPHTSLITSESIALKKGLFRESKNQPFLTWDALKTAFHLFITSSFSFYKHKYPHSWKTIFVHLLEKGNLLVRSDNNTGFSSSKVLQTTTI
ncbi:MAG TPA: hypothetical protein VF540_01410 [Segetibacter sp.]|jgi:hypothetical protein